MPLTHSRGGIEAPVTPGQKRPLFTVAFLCSSIINTVLIRVFSALVGCVRQLQGWPFLDGSFNLIQSATQRLKPKGGGIKSIPGDTAMNTCTQNTTTLSVSETCRESQLIEISLIIGSIAESNSSFTAGLVRFINKIGKPLSQLSVLELVTIIQDYRETFNVGTEPKLKQHRLLEPPPKSMTSRFNVLAKSSHKLIAKNIPFDQAKQFHNCVVKFSCMSAPGEEVAL